MTNGWGVGLPTALPLEADDLPRLLALGVSHYLCYLSVEQIGAWRPILAAIKATQPDARIHARIEARGGLDASADANALHAVCVALGDLLATVRIRNEPNVESPGVTPTNWRLYLLELGGRLHALQLPVPVYAPAVSPGLPNFGDFLTATVDGAQVGGLAGVDSHAYGSPAEALAVVDQVRATWSGALLCTETNFGAGRRYDLAQYARELPITFAGLAARGIPGCVFVWRWIRPDTTLPTTVDVVDTPAEAAIRDAPKPMIGGIPMPDVTLSVPINVQLTTACDPGPRAKTTHIFVHCTAGPTVSLQADYDGTIPYFLNPADNASAQVVIGPTSTTRMVHDDDRAWHARYNNETALGFELAMPAVGIRGKWTYTDYQYRVAAEMTRLWCAKYGIPRVRVMTEAQPGLIGHEDSEQGKADGKQDPGLGNFDWPHFLALVNQTTAPKYNIGPGFEQFLTDHPEAGLPRMDAFSDPYGNTAVWLTATPTYPNGAQLIWRKYLNRVTLVDWN